MLWQIHLSISFKGKDGQDFEKHEALLFHEVFLNNKLFSFLIKE